MDRKEIFNQLMCYMILVGCCVSAVAFHLSQAPTATATADPPLLTVPLCTVGWFAKTQNTKKNLKTQKIMELSKTQKYLEVCQY